MSTVPVPSERPEAPLFSDGLGDRVVAVDGASRDLLQILRVSPSLTAVPSFEFALRERTARLANFRHAYFARVRRIDRVALPAPGLAIVSDHIEGTRLSDILRVAEERRLRLDINTALCLIRQLVPAVALLHENARDVAHGLLAPERLIVTPHARLVIVEHVLGAAVEQLQYGRERLWHDLRVIVPASAGATRFDHRADVAGIGLVALSLIMGRLLRRDEVPHQLPVLISQARERSAMGDEKPLSVPLRDWLLRSLQLDPRRAFASAPEALAALEETIGEESEYVAAPVALEAFLSDYIAALLEPPSLDDVPVVAASLPVKESPQVAPLQAPGPVPLAPAAPVPPAETASRAPQIRQSPARLEDGEPTRESVYTKVPARRKAIVPHAPAPAAAEPAAPEPAAVKPAAPPAVKPAPAPVAKPAAAAQTVTAPKPVAAPPVPPAPTRPPAARQVPSVILPDAPATASAAPTVTAAVPPAAASGGAPPAITGGEPPVRPGLADLTDLIAADDLRPAGMRVEKPAEKKTGPPERPAAPAPAVRPLDDEAVGGAAVSEEETSDEAVPLTVARKPSLRFGRTQISAAAVALVVLAGGAYLFFGAPNPEGPVAGEMGTLDVQSNPSGVQIVLDGVERGQTPATFSVEPGAHILELRGRGVPRVIPITVAGGAQVSQYLELPDRPETGQLRIQSEPAGASVSVDGVDRGVTPASVTGLEPGDHEVVLKSAAGTVRQSVTVQAGATASLLVPIGLESGGAAVPVPGWIAVKAPVRVEIREDDRLLGTSDTERVMLPAGRHVLELVNEMLGYREKQTVQVPAGRTASLTVKFPDGIVNLNASPWAEVFIDGERVGETPIGNLKVPLGPHEVVFRHPQLGEKRHAISVTLVGPVRLSVDMK